MSEPGWYNDPGGQPGQYRYWDGARWSAQTSPRPGSGGVLGALRSLRTRPWVIIAVAASVLPLVLVLGLLGGNQRGGDPDPAPVPSSAPSSAQAPDPTGGQSPTAASSTVDPDLCRMGNRRYLVGTRPTIVHSGLALEYPENWKFQIHISDFGWLDDVYPWGYRETGANSALIIGRQTARMPVQAQLAVDQNWLCWREYSFLSGATMPERAGSATAIETNGVKGSQVTHQGTDEDGIRFTTILRVYQVHDAQVVVIGYWEAGVPAEREKQLRDALASIKLG